MSDYTPWSLAAAILTSLGGGAVIVVALFKWLGELTAKRILQREQNIVLASFEGLKQELSLARLSYDKHVQHVVEYYAMFYRSYSLAQRTANADFYIHPEHGDVDAKQDYLDQIDSISEEWQSKQGLLRILLPHQALDLHEKAIDEFNSFKDLVKKFQKKVGEEREKTRQELISSFNRLHEIKDDLEQCLREHLRTDRGKVPLNGES